MGKSRRSVLIWSKVMVWGLYGSGIPLVVASIRVGRITQIFTSPVLLRTRGLVIILPLKNVPAVLTEIRKLNIPGSANGTREANRLKEQVPPPQPEDGEP